jgi:hypothetical protein
MFHFLKGCEQCVCNKLGTVYLPESGLSLCDKKTGN